MIDRYLYIQVIFSIAFIAEAVILSFYGASEFSVLFLKIQLTFLTGWTLYTTKQYLKWASAYTLFLVCMVVFLFARVYLDLLGLYEFDYASRFGGFYFDTSVVQQVLVILLGALTLIHLGALYALKNQLTRRVRERSLRHNLQWEKVGVLILILSIPAFLTKVLIQLQAIASGGYLVVYTSLRGIDYPWWTVGSGTLMVIGFAVVLSALPPKKRFMIYSMFFIAAQAVAMLKGARGSFVISILFCVWFYYRFYSRKDIGMLKGALGAFSLISLSQVIGISRRGEQLEIAAIVESIGNFFAEQGVSVLVSSYMIHFKDQFVRDGIPYVFSPITTIGSFAPSQTVETISQYNMLGHSITYFLYPWAYLNGYGLGGSFLGELIDLPLLLAPIILCLIGYSIVYFETKVDKSMLFMILCYPVVFQFFKMPRGNLLPNINLWLPLVLLYLMFIFFRNVRGAR